MHLAETLQESRRALQCQLALLGLGLPAGSLPSQWGSGWLQDGMLSQRRQESLSLPTS